MRAHAIYADRSTQAENKKTMLYLIVIIFMSGFSNNDQKSNYLEYHTKFKQIEELIVNENFSEAEFRLIELFEEYEVKFVKDYIIASQVSILNKNKNLAIKYIVHSIRNGVKIECIKSIKLLSQELTSNDWLKIEEEYKDSRKRYLKKINLDLYQEFHKRFQEEQNSRRKDYYKSTVYSNFNRIIELLNKHGFVGEKLIGIDNQNFARSISECDLGNSKIIVTLLHYDYPISEIGEEKLIDAIKEGNLHPREFATIYSYEENKQSVLYKKSTKKYLPLTEYNFNFPFGSKIDNLEKVNSDRAKFGICKYEVDEMKEKIIKRYGIKLNFNYR